MAEAPGTNAVSIALPVDGYVNVARLVTAGLGSQLEFGFEAIDDLQLAIELALRSVLAQISWVRPFTPNKRGNWNCAVA